MSYSLKKDFLKLRNLWPYIKDQKKLLIIALILLPIVAVLEMSIPIVIKWCIDEGILKNQWDKLKLGVIAYFSIVLLQYLCRSSQALTMAYAVHRMVKTLRKTVIDHVMKLSCSFHDRNLSGSLVTRATSDFDNLSESLNTGVLTSLIDLAVLAGSLVGLFYLDWSLALSTIVLLPFIFLIVSWFAKKLKTTMMIARAKIASLNAFTQECLFGNTTVKLLTAQKNVQNKYDNLSEDYRKAQMDSVKLDASMFSIVDGLSSITVGIVLFVAVSSLTTDSKITVGLVIAFVQYIQQIFDPLKHLSNKIAMLQGAFTALDRIFAVLNQKTFVGGDKSIQISDGSLEFKHVSFAYKTDENTTPHQVLKDISFSTKPSSSLAIVGSTGSGKSTIVKLITKLYDGYSGDILIDGTNIEDISGSSLRNQISIVPQDIILFDGSIKFNIKLGREQISDEDIIHAAKVVGADSFIEELPGLYDFMVKEQGANLSHGQCQLIAFARALAKNPKMVVLDEATSSVDPESEALIQKGVDSMLADRATIVIAHRLSTIKKCDKILVIQNGQIVEQGEHNELLALKEHYFRLASALN